jgi:hypothetical protein
MVRSRLRLFVFIGLLVVGLLSGCGSSQGDISGVTSALQTERDADTNAIRTISSATRGVGPCYQTAAGQYQNAARYYNAWIRGATFRLRAGSSITDADLRSEDLRLAAGYSSLLRANANKVGSVSNFGSGKLLSESSDTLDQTRTAFACPFLKELGKAIIEEAVTQLVGHGLDQLLGTSDGADSDAKRGMATQLEQIQWPDLSRL